ncbi:bifunctional (p)ppGpp synthetase/guanosine-3',5'-bis(diphosphate) 3'-pyrophosphohydrolase [Candidatus Wolfebacteria bacterium]|nr:bifunctional (p)ppGpp synthetase/guanosine-3',5'-bis(diphosphate) 3'-pyrophosphohydrolase [Candidatus Wolfebacteria bacterium]
MNVRDLIKERQSKNFTNEEISLLGRAFDFSKRGHQGQKRKSGEPYFNHCFQTALQLANWQMDSPTIAAGLLHDIAEDTKYSLEEIKKEFGEEISFLVGGVTKLGHLKYLNADIEQAENLRKMILALSQDLRVIFIKLADRLHNIKTLSALSQTPNKQKRIALETSEIYATIAYRLGMANLAGELEDLSFPYINPSGYKWLIENIKEKYGNRQKYLEKVKNIIEKKLKESGIRLVKVDFRAKRYSSLYKKLLRENMNLEQIYDLVALRIIVNTIEECYTALGIVHQTWPPLPGRIKDYIAMPKPNGYRSLHTTVFCLDNKLTEFQIRTLEMHQASENGIAAHWLYEQKKSEKDYLEKKSVFAEKKELAWVEQLRSWQKEFSNSEEFLKSLKIDFLKDRIFAITPKGEVIDLPAGSTPVDFAYAIHTEIGASCVGSKINGKITPLDYQIQSGDLVEILVQKSKKPSESWLEFVKTSMAKKKIKSSVKKSSKLIKKEIAEFKITAIDRIGLLKDISSIFSRNRINIQTTNTNLIGQHRLIKIKCEADKEKSEKLILKLKKIKEIKEINYKII